MCFYVFCTAFLHVFCIYRIILGHLLFPLSFARALLSCQVSGEMTEVEPVLDFESSGRSGRRNALPDVLGSPAGVNPSDLPLKLAELSLSGQSKEINVYDVK